MDSNAISPKFLSLEFHVKFFLPMLLSRLRPRKREGTSFSPLPLDAILALAFCFILVIIGMPYALSHKSIIGWVVGGIGGVGMLVLFGYSIYIHWEEQPSFDCFLTGIFFFFVTLGITTGIFIGAQEHSFLKGLVSGSACLLAGYVLGIYAGLWFQRLAMLALLLNVLAFAAIIGMIILDLVLLIGS